MISFCRTSPTGSFIVWNDIHFNGIKIGYIKGSQFKAHFNGYEAYDLENKLIASASKYGIIRRKVIEYFSQSTVKGQY